jgi:hypothetical protein
MWLRHFFLCLVSTNYWLILTLVRTKQWENKWSLKKQYQAYQWATQYLDEIDTIALGEVDTRPAMVLSKGVTVKYVSFISTQFDYLYPLETPADKWLVGEKGLYIFGRPLKRT